MTLPGRIGLLFLALALLFLGLAVRDHLRAQPRSPLARRTWIRVAIIFAIVGVALQFLYILV
jgi:hypothetical protein